MPSPLHALLGPVDFDRGRLFETSDLDEARERCARVFNPHALRIAGAGQTLAARMDHLPLGTLSLNRLTWGADVAVDPDRLGSYYLLSLPVRGHALFHHGGTTTIVSPSCAGLVSCAPRFHFEATADFEQIVVRLERRAVDAAWHALAGHPAEGPIDFSCAVPLAGPTWQAIAPTLRLIARGTGGPSPALPHLAARLEDMLVTALLLHQPHSAAGLVEGAGGMPPRHLRRAEAFLCEHLESPLTVGEVARACGVARRTLQAAFQQAHGIGPMQWLRQRRLEAVREVLLRDASARPSIAQAALRFGFTHLGDFSRAYKAAFAETARDTLARRR